MAGGKKNLNIRYVGDASGLRRTVSEIDGANAGLASQVRATGLAMVGAFTAAAAGAYKIVSAYVSLGSEVRPVQRITGLQAEEASRLLFVSKDLGVQTDSLTRGFGFLAKNMVNGTANFTKYGIATTNANGSTKSLVTILGNAADRYVALGGGLKGTALAMNVFGRGGKDLIPILAKGSAGIADLMSQADRFGVVLSQNDVDATKAFSIAGRELGQALQGVEVQIARGVVPILTQFVDTLTGAVILVHGIPGPVLAAGFAFVGLATAIALTSKVTGILRVAFAPIGEAIRAAVTWLGEFATAFRMVAAEQGLAVAGSQAWAMGMESLITPANGVIAVIGLLAAGFIDNARTAALNQKAIVAMSNAIAMGATSAKDLKAAIDANQDIPGWAKPQFLDAVDKANQGAREIQQSFIQTATEIAGAQGVIHDAGRSVVSILEQMGTSSHDFAKQAHDAWKASEQDVNAWGDFIDQTLAKAKSSLADWRASASGNLNILSQDLSTLEGDAKLTADKILEAFKADAAATRQYGRDLETIAKTGGQAGKDLASALLASGSAGANMASIIAGANAKTRSEIISTFGATQNNADKTAGVLQRQIVGTLKDIRGVLEGMARAWGITLSVNDVQALQSINAMASRLRGLGFTYRGGDWLASMKMIVHTQPGSPWPDEAIAASMHRAGFKLSGGDWVGAARLELHVPTDQATRLASIGSTLVEEVRKGLKDGLTRADLDWARGWKKMADDAAAHMQRIEDRLSSFKGKIRAGFSGLADLGGVLTSQWQSYLQALSDYNSQLAAGTLAPGAVAPAAPDMAATIQQQVSSAQQLAALLKEAAKSGLSQALVAQFAGQGTNAIPVLQQLLANPQLIAQLNDASAAIAAAAGQTANALGDQYFGDAVRKAGLRLVHLDDQLQGFLEDLRSKIHRKGDGVAEALDRLAGQILSVYQTLGGSGGGGSGGGGGGGSAGGGGATSISSPPPMILGGRYGGGTTPPIITIHVHGAQNPAATALEVRRELNKIAAVNGGRNGLD